MTTTCETIAATMRRDLRHEIALGALVAWAEAAISKPRISTLFAIARLGVADVRAFGPTWEDANKSSTRSASQRE